MSTLFIGGIILVALMPLFKGMSRNVVDSHSKTSWDEAERMDQHIQQAKERTLAIFLCNKW